MPMKLHYFPLPGRAEVSRLLAVIGKLPVEDVYMQREQWPALKPKTPFGQLPVLEMEDGSFFAQSRAIEKFLAKKAGLYPADDLDQAIVDSAVLFAEDIGMLFSSTFSIQDLQEKIAARKKIVDGGLQDKLKALSKFLEGKHYVLGVRISWADIALYAGLANLTSGFYDGIDKSAVAHFPDIIAFMHRIASLPPIAAHYAKIAADDKIRLAFQASNWTQ